MHPAIDIGKLTASERLELIGDLWDSLREQRDAVPVPDAHRAVLDSRLDEIEAGDVEPISWPDAKRQLGR